MKVSGLVKRKGRKVAKETVNPEAEKAAIRSALNDYVKAVESEDIGSYGKVVRHDPKMVNFGSDASERIVGWEALKKAIEAQFVALSETRIAVSDITVNVAPGRRFAWATSLWDFKANMGGQAMALPVRCTWILEKRRSNWVIVHFHKSVGMTA